jgi:hypothetical protein
MTADRGRQTAVQDQRTKTKEMTECVDEGSSQPV